MNGNSLPNEIFFGYSNGGHCQGIAVDTARQYVYYSFTTELIKTDMQGNVVGSVRGLLGHMGCIAFNDADGRLYGSLEYKNDAIGKGILKHLGKDFKFEDAFYIAVFDVDKIDRMDMDATRDGVMKAVYLKEVVDDFGATVVCGGREFKHRLGCSGIDGTTFAPLPGSADDKKYLYVAYGVYSEHDRTDNDHQVILCYDVTDWDKYARALVQTDMHKSGPASPLKKLFVYTGNTNYGIQNLEYDAYTGNFIAAVYRGSKPNYPNYACFTIDATKAPVYGKLHGMEESGEMLSLAPIGLHDEASGTYGWHFRYGSTGIYSFGDGTYYFSHDGRDEKGWYTRLRKYVWDGEKPFSLAE